MIFDYFLASSLLEQINLDCKRHFFEMDSRLASLRTGTQYFRLQNYLLKLRCIVCYTHSATRYKINSKSKVERRIKKKQKRERERDKYPRRQTRSISITWSVRSIVELTGTKAWGICSSPRSSKLNESREEKTRSKGGKEEKKIGHLSIVKLKKSKGEEKQPIR